MACRGFGGLLGRWLHGRMQSRGVMVNALHREVLLHMPEAPEMRVLEVR